MVAYHFSPLGILVLLQKFHKNYQEAEAPQELDSILVFMLQFCNRIY